MTKESNISPDACTDVFLLSLGQFAQSDINKSKEAFIDIVKKQAWFPFLAAAKVNFWFLFDKYVTGYIDDYKLDNLKFSQFKDKICWLLGIKTSTEEFTKAWNAMCEVSDETMKKNCRNHRTAATKTV